MTGRVLVVLVAFVLVGCGSNDESGGDSSSDANGGTIEIVETDFLLTPATVSVEAAGRTTFRVVNDGATTHALEIDGPGLEEETDMIAPGDSAELTVELDAGEYDLYCPIGNHRGLGMEGTLVVGARAGAGGTETGKTDTDEDYGYGG